MDEKVKPPVWYWIVSVVAALWYTNSVLSFIMKECQWGNALSGATLGLGIAGLTGFLASIFLLLKKSSAYLGFVISFFAMFIHQSYVIFIYWEWVSTPYRFIYPIIFVLIGLMMVIMSRAARKKGWIK